MIRGKQTYKTLKEISNRFANAKDIEFVIFRAGILTLMILMSGCTFSKSNQSDAPTKDDAIEPTASIDNNNSESLTRALFSVERISKADFEKAKNSTEKYVYNLFGDSVVENNITYKIIQDARTRFENMDSAIRMDKYDIHPESEEYRDLFSSKSLILAKEHSIYGFILPTLHYNELYCYDLGGKFLGDIIMPFAISPSGIMVAQKDDDCDVSLDLHFYNRVANYVSEFLSFKDSYESITYITDYFSGMENNLPYTSFWIGDDLLFISFQSPSDFEQTTYLRISISKKD